MKLSPPSVDTILFDLDGTLIDSFEAFYQICKQACDKIGHTVPDRVTLYPVMNEGTSFFDYCFPLKMPQRQKKIEEFREESRRIWSDVFFQYVKIMPETEHVLQELSAKGYKLAIVTSSGPIAVEPLVRAGLSVYFDTIITSSDVKRKKPDPEALLLALERLQSSPEKAIMFGDTPMDIRAGRAAGLITAGVLSGTADINLLAGEKPDFIFPQLTGLIDLLQIETEHLALSKPSVLLQGIHLSGLSEAGRFLAIDWVRERMRGLTGFESYPGTFNMDLFPSSAERLQHFLTAHTDEALLFESKPGFCNAGLLPCRLYYDGKTEDAFVIIPYVANYPKSKLEIIAPTRLRDQLQVNESSVVDVVVYI